MKQSFRFVGFALAGALLALSIFAPLPAEAGCVSTSSCNGCAYTRTYCTNQCTNPGEGCEQEEFECSPTSFCVQAGCCTTCPPLPPE